MAVAASRAIAAFVHIVLLVAAHAARRQHRLPGHGNLVAGIAIEPAVSAIQTETGAGLMIEVPQLPAARVVAAFALRAQAPLVHILLVMARDAFGLGVPELLRQMALLARHHDVSPRQRKTRAPVIEGGALPVIGAVTGLALLALLALVHVILAVARETCRRGVLVLLVLVAAVAFHLAVLSLQGKSRLVVIEAGVLPGALAVAGAAQLAQGTLVLVLLPVTGNTRHRGLFEDRALVAGIARDIGMLPAQGETRGAMIETRLLPVAFDVTARTFAAERVLVLVVLLVT